jgi:hypothetical protein
MSRVQDLSKQIQDLQQATGAILSDTGAISANFGSIQSIATSTASTITDVNTTNNKLTADAVVLNNILTKTNSITSNVSNHESRITALETTPPPTPTLPSNIQLSALTVSENSAQGLLVATISATAATSYSIVSAAGGRFQFVAPNRIECGPVNIDYETATTHSITMRATNASGSTDATFTIQVIDVSEATGIQITGPSEVRFAETGAEATAKAVGIFGITGGTAPYTVNVDATGIVAPMSLRKVANGPAIAGATNAFTLAELNAALFTRTSTPIPGASYNNSKCILAESRAGTSIANMQSKTATDESTNFRVGNYTAVYVAASDRVFSGRLSFNSTGTGAAKDNLALLSLSNMGVQFGYSEAIAGAVTLELWGMLGGNYVGTTPLKTLTPADYSILSNIYNLNVSGGIRADVIDTVELRVTTISAMPSGVISFRATSSAYVAISVVAAGTSSAPDSVASPGSVLKVTARDASTGVINKQINLGDSSTGFITIYPVEIPQPTDVSIVEIFERVSNSWVSKGSLNLTTKLPPVVTDATNCQFAGSADIFIPTEVEANFPVVGPFICSAFRTRSGSVGNVRNTIDVYVTGNAADYPYWPMGDMGGKRTIVPQLKAVFKSANGNIVSENSWLADSGINDPLLSPNLPVSPQGANGDIGEPRRIRVTAKNIIATFESGQLKLRTTPMPIHAFQATTPWSFSNPGTINGNSVVAGAPSQVDGFGYNLLMPLDSPVTGVVNFASFPTQNPYVGATSRIINTQRIAAKGPYSDGDDLQGLGGIRLTRAMFPEHVAAVMQDPTALVLHNNIPYISYVRARAIQHGYKNVHHFVRGKMPTVPAIDPLNISTFPTISNAFYGSFGGARNTALDQRIGPPSTYNPDNTAEFTITNLVGTVSGNDNKHSVGALVNKALLQYSSVLGRVTLYKEGAETLPTPGQTITARDPNTNAVVWTAIVGQVVTGKWISAPMREASGSLQEVDYPYYSAKAADGEHGYSQYLDMVMLFDNSVREWVLSQSEFFDCASLAFGGFMDSSDPIQVGSWLIRTFGWQWLALGKYWSITASTHPLNLLSRASQGVIIDKVLAKITDSEIPLLAVDPPNVNTHANLNIAMMRRFGGNGGYNGLGGSIPLLAHGYQFAALLFWKATGLWDWSRSRNAKNITALNHVLAQHRKCSVGLLAGSPYILARQDSNAATVWPVPDTSLIPGTTTLANPVSPTSTTLPQSFADWATKNPPVANDDIYRSAGTYRNWPGQWHVGLVATGLKYVFGLTGTDIDAAVSHVENAESARRAVALTSPIQMRASLHFSNRARTQCLLLPGQTLSNLYLN